MVSDMIDSLFDKGTMKKFDDLAKKQAEGKAYRVAISHVARNLIRLIYRMEITGEVYHTKS